MFQIVFDQDLIISKVAAYLKDSIDKILDEKENVIIGLVGGRSISGILDVLKEENVDWSKIHIFMVDERLVPLDNELSNFRLINESLNDVISEENLHPFIYDEEKHDYSLASYESELKKYGGFYDIVVLSSGEDGHIASLFPNHSSLNDESNFFIIEKDSPKLPRKRMSISKNLLQKTKICLLLFKGITKTKALKKFLDKDSDIYSCPAKLVYSVDDSYVFTDIKLEFN